MNRLACIILTTLLFCQANAQEPVKLSPFTRTYFQKVCKTGNSMPDGYVYRRIAGVACVSVMVKVNSQANPEEFQQYDIRIGTRAGNVWTLQVPLEKLKYLLRIKGVEYIQLDEPVHPTADMARSMTRVDSVHAGLGSLPSPFHGKGVVLGIVDAGFDYRHPALFDTSGTRYRVKRIWEQKATGGIPPAGYAYGQELGDSAAIWADGFDVQGSHGAHVSGIAGGSGYGSANNMQYRGMADEADLVLVGITPDPSEWTSTGMSSIIDAINYIFSYAASVGKPAVVNLSWGCSIGPHDGLSLFGQACDNLTGPGKIFTLSAGNNGAQNLHLQKTFTASDTMLQSFVTFNSALGVRKTWVDAWGDTAKNFCVQLSLFDNGAKIDSTGFVCLDNQLHTFYLRNVSNDSLIAYITTSSAEFNGKPRIFLDIYNKASEAVLLTIKGTDGNVNAWSGFVENSTGYYADFVNNGQPWAVNGNNSMTTGDMATTRSALSVGAYISRTSFTNVNGGVVTQTVSSALGAAAPFTSRGPTADGRVKPDISAPGMVLGSSVSSFDPAFGAAGGAYGSVVHKWTDPQNSREYSYAMLSGTSMSAPVAAGIVALMLEANPSLMPQQVQDILAQTAITDLKTGVIPPQGSNTWGHGKINAMGAVQRALNISSVEFPAGQAEALYVFPNPASSSFSVGVSSIKSRSASFEVFDVTGRTIMAAELTLRPGYDEYRFDLKKWGRGIYLLRLRAADKTYTSRLLVE